MADVNVTDLTQETYSTMDGTEQVIMFDSAEGKRATVAAVGEYVLKKLTTSLNGSTQTVANALDSLNSEFSDRFGNIACTWSTNIGVTVQNNWDSLPKGTPFATKITASGKHFAIGYIYGTEADSYDGTYGCVLCFSYKDASKMWLVQRNAGTFTVSLITGTAS